MSKTVQMIVVGFAAAVVVSAGYGFLTSLAGEEHTGGAVLVGVCAAVGAMFIFYNLAGNRQIANASDADKRAALDQAPPPGKALLYLYREGYMARLVGMNLTVDGKPVVQLKSPRFACIVVAPGAHKVTGQFSGLGGAQGVPVECQVEAPADGGVAIRITAHMTIGKGGIRLEPQPDVARARAHLAGMPMTPPDLAEV